MNSFLQSIRIFFSDPKKVKLLVSGAALLAVVALLFSGYRVYLENREKNISLEVNQKVGEKNDVLVEEEEGSLTGEEFTNKMEALSGELYQIYQKYPGTRNGVRALITSAEIDLRLRSSSAEEKLHTVIADDGYLTPLAYYLLAHIYEDQGDYAKAFDALNRFQGKYLTHYLKPLVMLTEARLYRVSGQKEQATATYTQLLQNQEFSLFFNKAEEGIALLEMELQQEEKSMSDGLTPEYNTGFTPDYLQSNY